MFQLFCTRGEQAGLQPWLKVFSVSHLLNMAASFSQDLTSEVSNFSFMTSGRQSTRVTLLKVRNTNEISSKTFYFERTQAQKNSPGRKTDTYKGRNKVKDSQSSETLNRIPARRHLTSRFCSFIRLTGSVSLSLSLCFRTGLEAIMETYAFWRPPVRTLTFEDFTNMQKQQGTLIYVLFPRENPLENNLSAKSSQSAFNFVGEPLGGISSAPENQMGARWQL